MEGTGEHCKLVSCKMVEQLLRSFMWKPRRAVPLGVSWLQCHSLLQKNTKAELMSTAFAANLFNPMHYWGALIFMMFRVGDRENTLPWPTLTVPQPLTVTAM